MKVLVTEKMIIEDEKQLAGLEAKLAKVQREYNTLASADIEDTDQDNIEELDAEIQDLETQIDGLAESFTQIDGLTESFGG